MRGASGVNLVMGPDGSIHVGCTTPPRLVQALSFRGERHPWCLILRAELDVHLPLCPSCAAYVAWCLAKYAPN